MATSNINIRSGGKRIGAGNKRGQATLEFALVLPLLMLLLTGQLAFGIAMHNYLVLTNAVNIGSQLLALSRGQTADPCATASTALNNAAYGLTTANISLSFVINGATYAAKSCTAGAANMVQGAAAQVTATYPCTLAVFSMTFPSCSLGAQTTQVIQ